MTANPLAPARLADPADAVDLDPRIWSANAVRSAAGELTVAGAGMVELAAEYGTPLYVIDEQDARDRAALARASFDAEFARVGSSAHVYYAGKAFLCTAVVRWMTEAGLGIDVSSGGELAVAMAAGADPATIGYHGNNKSLAEIDRAVELGVGAIVIDSVIEVGRVAAAASRHGRRQRVRLRVNTGVHAHTHEYLATGREDQKFGIPIADVPDVVAGIRAEGSLEFLGLHSHIGSQIFDLAGFDEAARRLLAVHARLLGAGDVPELNLGGGFGIAYTSDDAPSPIGEVARRLADVVSAEAARLGIPVPIVAVEPGRSIIGPAGLTLYEVGTLKDVEVTVDERTTAVRRYLSIDGGMSDNVRPALYGADYTVRVANRASTAEPVLVRVAGKHCESGDIVVQADYLPSDAGVGDLLAVAATGAYCWSLASNYNYLGRPAVVAVRDSHARVIVRGETEADLLSRDTGIGES
ncbi:MAG: diaminopimelate decarboxylase [Microbacteriaceae bacterium]